MRLATQDIYRAEYSKLRANWEQIWQIQNDSRAHLKYGPDLNLSVGAH